MAVRSCGAQSRAPAIERAEKEQPVMLPGRQPPVRVGGRGEPAQLWLAPPKISLTEVSSKTASLASATTPATDGTSILSICFSGGSGRVLVTVTLEITEFLMRSMAGPENTPWV